MKPGSYAAVSRETAAATSSRWRSRGVRPARAMTMRALPRDSDSLAPARLHGKTTSPPRSGQRNPERCT